jgi:hypothetical protein
MFCAADQVMDAASDRAAPARLATTTTPTRKQRRLLVALRLMQPSFFMDDLGGGDCDGPALRKSTGVDPCKRTARQVIEGAPSAEPRIAGKGSAGWN